MKSSFPKLKSSAVSVKEEDFLDNDPPIRGQNYACISFVSPEDVLRQRDIFRMSKFLGNIATEIDELLTGFADMKPDEEPCYKERVAGIRDRYPYFFSEDLLQDEYRAFIDIRSGELDEEFKSVQGFQTSLRGFKIRGVYDSLDEARARAKAIGAKDKHFHVFVAQVGCWCPWSPSPEEVQDVEYAETQLNTLMKNYKENVKQRDAFFSSRKEALQSGHKDIDASDPWLDKVSSSATTSAAAITAAVVEEVVGEVVEKVAGSVSEEVVRATNI